MAPDAQLTDGQDRAAALDWLSICGEMARELEAVFARYETFEERKVHVGRGAGGDNTLVIDAEAEDAVFAILEREAAAGACFTALSEERGEVAFGGDDVLVVIDPIDGSLNAKRAGLSYSLSVGVARGGRTMADVYFGFVYDFGSRETWHATAGGGAFLNGHRLDSSQEGNFLEVVGLESTKPAFIPPELMNHWSERVNRLRSIGSIALTLCQVAAARFDAMCSLRACRSVDAAAGQLIVREAGGVVAFGELDALAQAPLDLKPHRPVVAARDAERAQFLLDGLALTGSV